MEKRGSWGFLEKVNETVSEINEKDCRTNVVEVKSVILRRLEVNEHSKHIEIVCRHPYIGQVLSRDGVTWKHSLLVFSTFVAEFIDLCKNLPNYWWRVCFFVLRPSFLSPSLSLFMYLLALQHWSPSQEWTIILSITPVSNGLSFLRRSFNTLL